MRVLEEADALLVGLEGELEVLVLLQKGGVVENDLERDKGGEVRLAHNCAAP